MFEDTMKQKTEQLTLDFGGRGEAPRRWSQGHLVSPAQDQEGTDAKAEEPAKPALVQELIEAMVSGKNPETALKKVEANKGAPGVDGMTVEELRPYLHAHWLKLKKDLLNGKYRPKPVRRVEIPKPDGGVRELGIPTALDRFIQQMVLMVMEPLYDHTFSNGSYGFRPGRSQHDAVLAAREYVAQGHEWVVDLDLEKFFDRVNHDILMGRIAGRIGDKRLLKLIRLYLQAGVMLNGVVVTREEGTPQGGPLSPLLSNILLDDLDKELEKRGHKFCRYADDCNIYVKTERAGLRVMESVTGFLEGRLKLRVNRQKSAVAKPKDRKFLGLRIVKRKNGALIFIAPKSLERLKRKIRNITRRNRGVSIRRVLHELKQLTDGWVNYFCLARTPSTYENLDSWIRRRLRSYIYKQWKNPRNRARQLTKLGVEPGLANGIAQSNHGYWKVAGMPAVQATISNLRLERAGFSSLHKRYLAQTSL